jgi:hypothetical protein
MDLLECGKSVAVEGSCAIADSCRCLIARLLRFAEILCPAYANAPERTLPADAIRQKLVLTGLTT